MTHVGILHLIYIVFKVHLFKDYNERTAMGALS